MPTSFVFIYLFIFMFSILFISSRCLWIKARK